MARKDVQAEFKAVGVDKMQRSLRLIERSLGDLGNAGKTMRAELSRASVGVGLAIAGFQAMKFAAEAAAAAVRGVTTAMRELSARGGDVISFAAAFERVGGNRGVLRALQEAANGYVQNADLMRAYTQAMDGGVLSQNEFVEATRLFQEAARDTGQTVSETLEALSRAATGGGMEGLNKININVQELNSRLSGTGLSAESAAGRARVLRMALDELRTRYGETTTDVAHTEDAVTQFMVALGDARDEAARAFASNRDLQDSLSDIVAEIRDIIPLAVEFGVALAGVAVEILNIARESAPMFINIIRRMIDAMQAIIDMSLATPDFLRGWAPSRESLEAFSGSLDGIDRSLYNIDQQIQGVGDSSREAEQSVAGLADQIDRIYTIGRGMIDEGAAGFDVVPESLARPTGPVPRRRAGGRRQEQREKPEDLFDPAAQEDFLKSLEALEAELHSARMTRLEEQKTSEMELADKHAEERAAELEHFERMKEMEIELAEKSRETAAAARERMTANAEQAASWGGVVSGQLSNIGGMFGQLADKKQQELETMRQAMRAMGKSEQEITEATKKREKAVERARKAEGAFLVAQNIVLAATEIARAIGAIPNPVLIASHAASAAAHIVAAGIAASKLGGGGGGGAGASMPSVPSVETFTPADDSGVQAAESEGPRRTNIVNYYSLGRSGEDLGRALRNADYEYERSDGRAVGGLGVSYS